MHVQYKANIFKVFEDEKFVEEIEKQNSKNEIQHVKFQRQFENEIQKTKFRRHNSKGKNSKWKSKICKWKVEKGKIKPKLKRQHLKAQFKI